MNLKTNLLIAISLYYGAIATVECLEDGDLYKITHAASGKVLTVGSSQPVDGVDTVLSDWTNQPNQKWLAVQAVVAGNNYLLLSQQQRWNWNTFLRNGESLRETKERHDSLPDWSLVLNGDNRGVTLQPRDSKKYQQWKSESNSGSTKVIIKNIQENKCLQAPGASTTVSWDSTTTTNPTTSSSPGILRRIRNWFGGLFGSGSSSTTVTTTTTTTTTPRTVQTNGASSSNKVSLATCDNSNSGQQWTLERLSIR